MTPLTSRLGARGMVLWQVGESMGHKPKAKAKRSAASREAAKSRPVAKGVASSSKKVAAKSRLKPAKVVTASAKAKAVRKKVKPGAAAAAPAAQPGAKPSVTASPAVAVGKKLALRTRKPKTPLSAAKQAKFALGQVVKHRIYAFRGVVFDIDPVFSNTEDWWLAIPADVRPRKDQPFYHLLAENDETEYIAYVSEQNLIADTSGQPLRHPQLAELFVEDDEGRLRAVFMQPN